MKKILALVLALTMMATVVSAFAADNLINGGNTPASQNNTAKLTIQNPEEFANGAFSQTAENRIEATGIEEGDSVSYYQLLAWNGNTIGTSEANGSHGWILTTLGEMLVGSGANSIATTKTAVVEALLDGISLEEAGKIAATLASATATGSMTAGTPYYAENVAVGLYYLKAVATKETTIYNPAFVGADYYAGNNSVDFSDTSKIDNSATVKKSTLNLSKEVVGNKVTDDSNYTQADTYNDVNSGDYIPYKITTKIPAYDPNTYSSAVFTITDTLSTGLELAVDAQHPFAVKLNTADADSYTATTAVDVTNYTINFTTGDAGKFVLNFKNTYLVSDRGVTDLVVTYWAKVNENAIDQNVNEKDNDVELTFTHAPGQDDGSLKDRTRHYSFTIDGEALGKSGTYTSELIKVGLSEDGTPITEGKVTYRDNSQQSPLAGATFTLTGVAGTATAGISRTCVTGADGRIEFKDLDAGDYTLQETAAPSGYVKDGNVYTIYIIPTYTSDGTDPNDPTPENDVLVSYQIIIKKGSEQVGAATFTLTSEKTGYSESVTGSSYESASNFVANRQGNELPSTGGIGTTIFYLVGGLMVMAAGIVLVSRKKAEEE